MSPSPSPQAPKPFFIGWEARPVPAFVTLVGLALVAAAVTVAGLTATWQSHIGPATWDFAIAEHHGILLSHPAPMLVETVDRGSGAGADSTRRALRFLVKPDKFGFSREELDSFHLKPVILQASLLENGGRSMLEVTPGSIAMAQDANGSAPHPSTELKNPQKLTLRGEIIDSKCYLGAMNPGQRKTHRACAIHCLRGGIPAAFLARDRNHNEQVLLLTSPAGDPLNHSILDFVAEPVEVTGTVSYAGDLPVFAIDLASLRRLTNAMVSEAPPDA